MTLNAVPAFARSLSHPEIVFRNAQQAIFGGRTGAIRVGDFAIAPTGVTRQFSVAGGRAYIQGRENTSQGGYVAFSDGTENLVLPAPAASPRIDTLLLQVYDDQYGTLPSGTSRAEWRVVSGVAAASPSVRPDSDFLLGGSQYVPGAWWRVADFRSNPGDSTIPANQIYPTMTFARIGGVTLCNSTASVTGFGGRPTDPAMNDTIRELDTGISWRWNGTTWRLADRYRIQHIAPAGGTPSPSFTVPSWAKSARITWAAKSAAGGNIVTAFCRINGATTGYYYQRQLQSSSGGLGVANVLGDVWYSVGHVPGGAITNQWGLMEMTITGLGNTSDRLHMQSLASVYVSDVDAHQQKTSGMVLLPKPWNTISFILFSGNFDQNSVIDCEFMD